MLQKHRQQIVQRTKALTQGKKIRFILVGISNTLIDFAIFNVLTQFLAFNIVWASIVSTTIAMAASYLLNKQAVFRNGDRHHMRQVILFLAVTLSGIWLIQTIVMVHVFAFLQSELVRGSHPLFVWFLQNTAKAAGVLVGAVWNYLGYSRIVFKDEPKP